MCGGRIHNTVATIEKHTFSCIIFQRCIGRCHLSGSFFHTVSENPLLLWSSVFVTRVSNKLMSNTSLRMAYDSRYKNAVVHDCMWYKQNAPLRDREIPHLDTHEDKFLRSSAY